MGNHDGARRRCDARKAVLFKSLDVKNNKYTNTENVHPFPLSEKSPIFVRETRKVSVCP